MRVRWNSSNSRGFLLSNGVKQGGVLSPLLFSVYLDDLLCELPQVNVGCHMNRYFVGAVIYADDITLLGPTRSSILSVQKIYIYNDVTVDISSNCICESECHTHVISSIIPLSVYSTSLAASLCLCTV